jgi:hypothetical protein
MTSEAGVDAALVVGKSKFKSDDGVQTGAIELPRAGTVVLRFDNVHSMFRSKTVRDGSPRDPRIQGTTSFLLDFLTVASIADHIHGQGG